MRPCKSREVKAKDLASLIGLIISLAVCVGNVTRIMSLYEVLNGKVSWVLQRKTNGPCNARDFVLQAQCPISKRPTTLGLRRPNLQR